MSFLIGKQAICNNEEVTIVSDVISTAKQLYLVVMYKSGKLCAKYLSEVVVKTFTNQIGEYSIEFEIDWSKVKYDHLRMDSNGKWHSYESDDLYFNGDEWMRGSDNYLDYHCEEHIDFVHPNPEKSIYTHPKWNMSLIG